MQNILKPLPMKWAKRIGVVLVTLGVILMGVCALLLGIGSYHDTTLMHQVTWVLAFVVGLITGVIYMLITSLIDRWWKKIAAKKTENSES